VAALTYGHALPAIDPSMIDDVDLQVRTTPTPVKKRRRALRAFQKTNGNGTAHTNGNGHGVHAGHSAEGKELAASMASRTSLSAIGGRDVFEKAFQFTAADNARKMGVYPFFRPLDLNDGPEAVLEGRRVVMFGSNNYLGLTTHPRVREAARDAINKFGTSMTGSRLVNGSMKLHNELEGAAIIV
jgi:hypothetical protein